MSLAESQGESYGSALPKHVSAEGCQLVLDTGEVHPGQRFRFELGGSHSITGTVRWSVGYHHGFVFDAPLCRTWLLALATHGQAARSVRLVPVPG